MTVSLRYARTTRRRALASGIPIAALAALGSACTRVMRPDDNAAGFRLTADFEPTRAIWLSHHPAHAEVTAALVQALRRHVTIRMLVADAPAALAARQFLQARGFGADRIEVRIEPLSIFFLRDAAVFARGPGASSAVIDFRWSQYGLPGWCALRHPDDPAGAARCAAPADGLRHDLDLALAALTGARVISSDLVMEGGGIEVNGQGLIIANEALVRQRNPGRSRQDLQAAHLALPGIRKVIWLPQGLAEDPLLRSTIVGQHVGWGTGGHTDEFVRFADPRTVLLAWPDEADPHPVARLNRQRMQANADILARERDADGRPLRVVKLPMPRLVTRRIFLSAAADRAQSAQWSADEFPPHERRREGDPVIQVAAASYLNFVVANGVVVVPGYLAHGTPAGTQERVRRLLVEAFPGREIVFIDALGLNWVGAGPHCATLNEPAVAEP